MQPRNSLGVDLARHPRRCRTLCSGSSKDSNKPTRWQEKFTICDITSAKSISVTFQKIPCVLSHMRTWDAHGLRMQQTSAQANSVWRLVVNQARAVTSQCHTDRMNNNNDSQIFSSSCLSILNGFAHPEWRALVQPSTQCDESNRRGKKCRQ